MILYCFRFQSGIFIIVDFVQNQVTVLFSTNLCTYASEEMSNAIKGDAKFEINSLGTALKN